MRPRPPRSKLGVRIQFSRIFGKRPTLADMHEAIRPLKRQDVLLSLAWIISVTKGTRIQQDNQLERKIWPHFLPSCYTRLSTDPTAFVFSRFTVLWLMKQACLVCDLDGQPVETIKARERLGIGCLMANDLMDDPDRNLTRRLDVAASMMAAADMYSFDEHDRDIVRTRFFLRDIAKRSRNPQARDLPQKIEGLLGENAR